MNGSDISQSSNDLGRKSADSVLKMDEIGREYRASRGSESNVNMAASYADTLKNNNNSNETQSDSKTDQFDMVKPIFINDQDIFGSVVPTRNMWVKNVEIYKSIGKVVKPQCIRGIQRMPKMWRIYMDNDKDKAILVSNGINLRGKHINFHLQNPRVPVSQRVIKIIVKNVPLSADDGQIERTLTKCGVDVKIMWRERLRVDGLLTNCFTGDRHILTESDSLVTPLPRFLSIGKYNAKIFHPGQISEENRTDTKVCHKCLEPGHVFYHCQNDWKCKICKLTGHKMADCPQELQENMFEGEMNDTHNKEDDDQDETDYESDQSEAEDSENIDHRAVNTEDVLQSEPEKDDRSNVRQKNVENILESGQMSEGQASKQIDKRPLDEVNKKDSKSDNRKHKQSGRKSVTISDSQNSIRSFMKTPQTNTSKQKNARTPPTPPQRDGGTKSQKK